MNCSNCGAEIKPGEKFCSVCGEKVKIYAQGLAESCLIDSLEGDHMIADIGKGTMNLVRLNDGMPIEKSLTTEKYGVGICIRNIRGSLSVAAQAVGDDLAGKAA